MKYRVIKPRNLSANVTLPASKSISNRAIVLNALSGSPIGLLANISDCDDTSVMLATFFLLDCERREGKMGQLLPTVNIKAAGTAMRFLTAYLSANPDLGTRVLTGSERMQHRPIGILVEALRTLGAQIKYVGEEGYPPLRITGVQLHGGDLTLSGSVSSQYISALLMVAPLLEEGLVLHLKGDIVSRPYINMTIAMMREHGAEVKWKGPRTIAVSPGHPYRPTPYVIESDWSAASYWYEIEILSQNKMETLSLQGLFKKSIQGDKMVAELFKQLSVQTFFYLGQDSTHVLLFRRGRMAKRLVCDFTNIPDLAQTLVVTCSLLGIPFHFSGLQSLRIKETDRIAALQKELRKLGVQIEVEGDSVISWAGPGEQELGEVPYLHPVEAVVIDTYDDHRMAMAFAPAALVIGQIDINNPEVVSKSYPHYWDDLQRAGFDITSQISEA